MTPRITGPHIQLLQILDGLSDKKTLWDLSNLNVLYLCPVFESLDSESARMERTDRYSEHNDTLPKKKNYSNALEKNKQVI